MATRRRGTGRGSAVGEIGRVLVMMEQMQEQNRATIEAVQAVESSLSRRIEDGRRDLTLRMEALEAVVRQNSADIRQNSADIRQNSSDIQRLQEQIAGLTDAVRQKVTIEDLRALEARVAKLEQQVGI